MARAPQAERPKNREVENEMIRPPEHAGEPPKPATEPSRPKRGAAGKARPGV